MKPIEKNIYNFEATSISGEIVKLSKYQGRVLLIVNVASKCGFTPQYLDLQKLYEKYKDRRLRVLAFPCNDFGHQEPGENDEIKSFCQNNFKVTFDLFSKVNVLGSAKHPLYQYLYDCGLLHQGGGGGRSQLFSLVKWVLYRVKGDQVPVEAEAKWNFHKFLVSKKGIPVASYLSEVKPDNKMLIDKLEEELQK